MNIADSSSSAISSQPSTLNLIKFGIFLTLQIPSVTCSVYLLFQYATRRELVRFMHHHIIIALLCTSLLFVLVPISASEAFFFTSYVRPTSYMFCSFWTLIHYSINIGNLLLMAFACGQRHWLIFRLNALGCRRDRLAYHYIPMAACIIYPWIFYFALIFLYPCESVYDFTQLLCIMPCYFTGVVVSNIDTWLNNNVPILAIPLLSGSLFIRFLIQKRRAQMTLFRWKRDRKMVIELLTVTLLYTSMWLPVVMSTIFAIIWRGGMSSQFEIDYLYCLPYFIHLVYPFLIFFSNGHLRQRGWRLNITSWWTKIGMKWPVVFGRHFEERLLHGEKRTKSRAVLIISSADGTSIIRAPHSTPDPVSHVCAFSQHSHSSRTSLSLIVPSSDTDPWHLFLFWCCITTDLNPRINITVVVLALLSISSRTEAAKYPRIETQQDFDVTRVSFAVSCMCASIALFYSTGLWYKAYRSNAIFEISSKCVNATYVLNADSTVGVWNRAINRLGQYSSICGSTTLENSAEPGALDVTFGNPALWLISSKLAFLFSFSMIQATYWAFPYSIPS